MKTLVTGGGGFLGGHLIHRLINEGHEVRAIDLKSLDRWWQLHPEAENLVGDLRNETVAAKAVHGMEWVYDLAEDMGGVQWLEANRADGLASFRILLNVAEASYRAGVERLWFASSACAYNTDLQLSPEVQPLRESDITPAKPEQGYGEAKWMGERLCEYYQREARLETRVGRYHNIYAAQGVWQGERAKAPAAICRKVAEATLSGVHEIEIWGDGSQTRSFCYVDDCVEGTLRLMNSDVSEPLNIGSSELVSINELVSIVEDIAGVSLQRRYLLDAPQGVRGRSSDNALIKERLGWEPSIPLRVGLEQTYSWVEEQVAASTTGRATEPFPPTGLVFSG